MADLARGQRVALSAHTPLTKVDLGVDVSGPAGLSYDVSLFGLGAGDRLVDDAWLVFYNNPSSPGNAVRALGPHGGDEQVFRVDLALVPAEVLRLVVAVTVDATGSGGGAGAAATMASIARGHVRVVAGGAAVLRYPYYGADFTVEQSVVVAEVYRHAGDGWRVGAVGQGYAGGLAALVAQFGGEVVEEEPAPDSAAPAPLLRPVAEDAPPALTPGGLVPPPPPASPPPPPATPPPAPVRELVGPDLTVRQEYRVLSVRDRFLGGRLDPEQLEQAVSAYSSQGWTVAGTCVDRRGRSRDDVVVLLARDLPA